MVIRLVVLEIILLIIGILTPIASGTVPLISVILFVMAIVLSNKKRKRISSNGCGYYHDKEGI